MPSLRQTNPALRLTFVVAGLLLFVAGVVVAPVPGPGGVFFFIAGLALILPNSRWAMRRFVAIKRRWPRVGDLADRLMRRASARRRRDRIAAERVD